MRSDNLCALSAENLARLIQFSTTGIQMLDGSVLRGEVVRNPVALEPPPPPANVTALRKPAVILDFVLGRASA